MILLLGIPFVMQGQNSIKCSNSEINKKYFEEHPATINYKLSLSLYV